MSIQTDIEIIIAQEKTLRFKSFSESDAWALGSQMRQAAADANLTLVIDIRTVKPLFYAAMPGTTAENPDWVRRKINTVMRFERSSYRLGLEYQHQGRDFGPSRGIDVMNHAPAGGGFPIHVIGTGVVGVVTVSGLPQRQDHIFVVENLARFLKVPMKGLELPPDGN